MPELDWGSQVDYPRAAAALRELQEGYQRFCAGTPQSVAYSEKDISDLWEVQKPIAAVISCCDSRVSPEIIFDQPLGRLFVSRVPGNVASDSAKWMLDIAVAELNVPVIIVVGHVGCLAVKQMVDNRIGGSGGMLRFDVGTAVHRARVKNPADVFRQSVIENVYLTIENLREHSTVVSRALEAHSSILIGAVYDMQIGTVELLPEVNPTR